MSTAKLYLIPVDIGNKNLNTSIPDFNNKILSEIEVFGCENVKTGRRFLINAGMPSPIPEHIQMFEIKNDNETQFYAKIINAILEGKNAGYMSEAGNPCIADPGERLVAMAHDKKIQVVPLVGPSSILLALIASGIHAEKFTFNGYMSRDNNQRLSEIRDLVRLVESGITQIFMETPYRNNQMLSDVIKTCPENMRLCVAVNLNTDDELIVSRPIKEWRSKTPDIHKKPAIFVLGMGF